MGATAGSSLPRQAAAQTGGRGGPRGLGSLLRALLTPAARARGFAEAALLTDWPRIAGPDLASWCRPLRLRFPPGKGEGARLELAVAPARLLELQHQTPLLVERINGFFGRPVVARLRLVPWMAGALERRPPPTPRLPPDPAALARIRSSAERAPPALRQALLALGAAIVAARGREAP